jgi:hypothetical protein
MSKRPSIVAVAVVSFAFAGATTAAGGTKLPAPCLLLKRSEANVLAGIKLEPPVASGASCTYNPVPTGPTAQVFVFVDPSLPITLTTDRRLHHAFRSVRHLGDQALEENGYIFVRKGSVWITLHVLAQDPWPGPRARLEHAAALAVARVNTVRRLAAVSRAPPMSVHREHWTGSERRFGGNITNYAGVDYQPAVVLIGGGAKAIRAVSHDGLTWTINSNAPGAAELRVGKIMLATTLASGRVLKLTRVGPNLRVVLGPVAVTDVIRDGVFDSSAPISLGQPIAYKTALPAKPVKKPRRKLHGVDRTSAAGEFSASGFCCSPSVGVHIGFDNGNGRLSALVALYAQRPTVSFQIAIGGGHLIDAALQLHVAGGLRFSLEGATLNGAGDVKSGALDVPASFAIPLAGPLAITFTQAYDVSMQFAGRATVKATGDYRVNGDVGFHVGGGGAPTPEPVTIATKTPITQNTLSLGVGVNAISIGWKVRATVGIGLGVFSAGAWAELRAGLAAVADGSNLESLKFGCARSDLDVTSLYGVGYTIPEYVRTVVNAVLGAIGAKPVAASGGPWWGPYTLWHPPPAQWCPPRH